MPERKRLQEGPLVATFPVEIYQNFRSGHIRKYLTSIIPKKNKFPYLNPLLKARMVTENFHARLSVRIVSRFESQLFNAQFAKELIQYSLKFNVNELLSKYVCTK